MKVDLRTESRCPSRNARLTDFTHKTFSLDSPVHIIRTPCTNCIVFLSLVFRYAGRSRLTFAHTTIRTPCTNCIVFLSLVFRYAGRSRLTFAHTTIRTPCTNCIVVYCVSLWCFDMQDALGTYSDYNPLIHLAS